MPPRQNPISNKKPTTQSALSMPKKEEEGKLPPTTMW